MILLMQTSLVDEVAHDTDNEEFIIIDAYRLALFYAPALEQIAILPLSFIATAENAVVDDELEEEEKTAAVAVADAVVEVVGM